MTKHIFGAGQHTFSTCVHRRQISSYLTDKLGRKIWKIEIEPFVVENEEAALIHMDCVYDYKSSNLWLCDVEIWLQVKIDNVEVFTQNMEHCFDKNLNRIYIGKIPGNFGTQRKTLQCLVNIRIKSLVGIQDSHLSFFSVPQKIDSEVTLIVGDHRLYIDRYVFVCFSPVFRGIFNNGLLNDEIEIEDVTVEQCIAFLRLLYRQKEQLRKDTVEGVLKLSIRYRVPFIVTGCEEMLLSTDQMTIIEKLRLSKLYNLSTLQEDALKQQQQFQHDMTLILESYQNKAVALVQTMEEAIAETQTFVEELQKYLAENKKQLELIKVLKTAQDDKPDQLETLTAFQLQHPPERRWERTLSDALLTLDTYQTINLGHQRIIPADFHLTSQFIDTYRHSQQEFNTCFSNLFEITLSPQGPAIYQQHIVSSKNAETMK